MSTHINSKSLIFNSKSYTVWMSLRQINFFTRIMSTLSTKALEARNQAIKSGEIKKELLQDESSLQVINALFESLYRAK